LSWGLLGGAILFLYGVLPTLQTEPAFGRVYAAYGGIFIILYWSTRCCNLKSCFFDDFHFAGGQNEKLSPIFDCKMYLTNTVSLLFCPFCGVMEWTAGDLTASICSAQSLRWSG